jgi:AP-4 complex subunit mu-1
MFISQLFILSSRGDKIVFKDYRQDVPRNADETFFRHTKFWGTAIAGDTVVEHQAVPGDCPPYFMDKNICFTWVRKNGVSIVAASRSWSVSPLLIVEALTRVVKVLKDFLGTFSEDSIRKNFTLVYELLDEMIDSGVVQEMSSERLKPYIFTEPVVSQAAPEEKQVTSSSEGVLSRLRRGDFGLSGAQTRKSTATAVSIIQSGKERKNEIYIDVIERLNVTFNAQGSVVTSEVDGTIVMKSFLAGSPDLYLGLNEDLVVGNTDGRGRYATVCLDSVNFHEAADYSKFETERTVVMRPPDGEFTVMNYRSRAEVSQPFRVIPSIELVSTYKAELTLRVRGDIPATTAGINVIVRCPVPKAATSVSVELGVGATGQTYEYRQADRTVLWKIPKFKGGTEQIVKIGIATGAPITPTMRKEIGPVTMQFEVPSHNVTGIQIRFLRLEERSKSYNPQRWVRNITQAASYVTRIT